MSILDAMNELLAKSEGEFRGGDPEELQMKQQDAKESQADAGDTGDDNGDGVDEDAQIADADKESEAEDKLASFGKSGPSISVGGAQVSPVNTDEDYEGDLDEKRLTYPLRFRGEKHPFEEPCALDRREHQNEVWSEALGFKIPLEGNPIFYLRRFALRGDKDGYRKATQEVFKAVGPEPVATQAPGAQQLLENLDSLNRDQLLQVAKSIWGEDYDYEPWMDDDYIREDVRGSLMDLTDNRDAKQLDQIRGQMTSSLEW